MRKRRSPKVVWLPQTNANSIGANDSSAYQQFIVGVAGDPGDFAVGEIPLTIDQEGQDPLSAGTVSLSDMFNSGYRLRRIVGKIFCLATEDPDLVNGPASVLVTAGIIVRRINPQSGQSLAFLTLDGEEASPGEIRNAGDPWVWRRSWQLNNIAAVGAATSFFAKTGITKNYGNQAGSVADGPHVDQKTARIVGPEERLFLTVSVTALTTGTDAQTATNVLILTDLRVLASMRTSLGNRRNASR